MTSVPQHWLYGIDNLTEGLDAHRHKVFWRKVHIGYLNDPLQRQEDAMHLASICLLLESRGQKPHGLLTDIDWQQKVDPIESQLPLHVVIWTLIEGAVDPCRIFLLDTSNSAAPLEEQLAVHIMAFRSENGLSRMPGWVCSHALIQTHDDLEYALSQLHEHVPEGFDLDAIEATRRIIHQRIESEIPVQSAAATTQTQSDLTAFTEVVQQQVKTYWGRLVKPIASTNHTNQTDMENVLENSL